MSLDRDGSWYVNCSNCRADYHVVGHNRFAGRDDWPEFCAFCGSMEIEVEPEADTAGVSDQ